LKVSNRDRGTFLVASGRIWRAHASLASTATTDTE
jgi:hypothetical protein